MGLLALQLIHESLFGGVIIQNRENLARAGAADESLGRVVNEDDVARRRDGDEVLQPGILKAGPPNQKPERCRLVRFEVRQHRL